VLCFSNWRLTWGSSDMLTGSPSTPVERHTIHGEWKWSSGCRSMWEQIQTVRVNIALCACVWVWGGGCCTRKARYTPDSSPVIVMLIHSFTGAYSPGWTFDLPFRGFLITHIQTHGRTPLDEWSARLRDLLPTQDIITYKQNRQTSMPRVGLEPATPATKRPQTYALNRAAAGIGYTDAYTSRETWMHSNPVTSGSHWNVHNR
jgi:hypothetical protein